MTVKLCGSCPLKNFPVSDTPSGKPFIISYPVIFIIISNSFQCRNFQISYNFISNSPFSLDRSVKLIKSTRQKVTINDSRPFVKLKAKSLELTLFQPCHNKKNKNPSPKSIRRGCTRSMKFEGQTTHGLLAEFRWLGVHVTRITRTTTKKFPDPKFFSAPIFFWTQHCFWIPKFFQA